MYQNSYQTGQIYPTERDEYANWETYPQNLHVSPLGVDAYRSSHQIDRLSKELFVANHESSFDFLAMDPPRDGNCRDAAWEIIQSFERLDALMELGQATSVFSIHQSYTWSRLCISEEHFRRLFTRLGVHPGFLDVVFLFREKLGPVEEGFSSAFVDISPPAVHDIQAGTTQGCSYHIGYNIKYVARHGRALPNDPFSIREVGVYQYFSSDTQQSNWVLLQASDRINDRLRRAFQSCDDTLPKMQFLLHSIILLDGSEDWREYMIYLEDEFTKLVDKGFFTNLKGSLQEGDLIADFSDLRKLQILTDKLRRLVHILKLNIRLGNLLKRDMARIKASSSSDLRTNCDAIQRNLDKYVLDQETHFDRLETLIARSSGIIQLVQSIQDIRSAEASQQINHEMQTLTEQGVKENKLMKRLTEQSTRDTRSMMTIALISAVFLPATFLATLFGSNFFVYSQPENSLTVASNFWVYIIFTAAFSGATVLLWYIWRQRRLQRDKENDMEAL
ncbi:hypothetical protein K458DRAFT_433038 [Lentithecium fluviatile CBS 122367]|uniref:CorA-like transporter domain-containing protein n=1 Tax=Lentithecium fluviatile CBS 122367 TaxID=1168545 RepID=A0A6G1IV95_9PLEO|nr:hypothetical protein K458DRAFT_433038 [Lentithecium fluviatile CBS 122367]